MSLRSLRLALLREKEPPRFPRPGPPEHVQHPMGVRSIFRVPHCVLETLDFKTRWVLRYGKAVSMRNGVSKPDEREPGSDPSHGEFGSTRRV